MRKKILAANWKMNLTQPQVLDWLKVFHDLDFVIINYYYKRQKFSKLTNLKQRKTNEAKQNKDQANSKRTNRRIQSLKAYDP